MPEFCDHPILTSLSMELSRWITALVAELLEEQDGSPEERADAVYLELREVLYDGGRSFTALPETAQARMLFWFERAPVRPLADAIAQFARDQDPAPPAPVERRPYKKATPQQLEIIREAQRDVNLDFTRLFPELTAWEADSVIKGLLVISEVLRLTGDRHFRPRDIRAAIRDYLHRHPEAAGGGRRSRSSPGGDAR